jgi:2-octaprenyl-6-methoxyphenol hydroxylase
VTTGIRSDIAVVGTGPTGIAAALALAHVGAKVALIGPAPLLPTPVPFDTRTAALLASSVDMLKALGAWEAILPHAAALRGIRIVDAAEGPLRAPDVEFRASELGLEAFGYNVANSLLVEALYARAAALTDKLEVSDVEHIALAPEHATLRLKQGDAIRARLLVGADGRHSICRTAAGIGVSERATDQAAIATRFIHVEPHRGISTELHRRGGSVTTVPLPAPCASSLIWVGATTEIDTLMERDAMGFGRALEARLEGVLGRIGEVGARGRFAVAPLAAESLVGPRTALVGEAAHILPPIGAQGLNLGLRDAATLADCVADALQHGGDPGGEDALRAYQNARKLDVLTRTLGIDLLNRSLLSGFLPVQAARGVLSHGLNALPLLRRLVMRVGMVPPTTLPSLMRPAAGD